MPIYCDRFELRLSYDVSTDEKSRNVATKMLNGINDSKLLEDFRWSVIHVQLEMVTKSLTFSMTLPNNVESANSYLDFLANPMYYKLELDISASETDKLMFEFYGISMHKILYNLDNDQTRCPLRIDIELVYDEYKKF